MRESEEWLTNEEMICRADRVTRLDWLATITPNAEYLTFPGGLTAKYLFDETRYSFVYGQFLASILLGFAFIEMTLAAWFHMSGRDDLDRVNVSKLLSEAKMAGWLTEEEHSRIEAIRRVRNPAVHFRAPLAEDSIEYRAFSEHEHTYSVIEKDARAVVAAVMHMLGRNAV
jgi:hypothetical protein